MIRVAAAVAAVAVLAGCGGGTHGTATLWVTRDEGKTLLLSRAVPAGETAMQALERSVRITTRYGGRYVESIDGVAGSLSAQHDWFYFVNGIEADRGAADYVLHPGDVEWWDYRDWGRYGQSVPVVVGAFPEPFLHGYDGKVPAAYVVTDEPARARPLARLLHARIVRTAPAGGDVLVVRHGDAGLRFFARRRGAGIEFVFTGDPLRLARHPAAYRYRYSAS